MTVSVLEAGCIQHHFVGLVFFLKFGLSVFVLTLRDENLSKVRGFCSDKSNPGVFDDVNVYGNIYNSDFHHTNLGPHTYGEAK